MKGTGRCIISFALLWPLALFASPVEQARQRIVGTFSQVQQHRVAVDQAVIQRDWNPVPFDQTPFTFTFAEIKTNWNHLMRGLQIPFPSPEYLEMRVRRFPDLQHELRFRDTDWEMHSLNILEVWQAFFRGDFRKARDLGIHYGGYAQVPGVFAQIIYAVYLTDTYAEKLMHLQDALDRVAYHGMNYPYLPGEDDYQEDYVMMRLGLAYAVARLAEDEPVGAVMTAGYAPLVINVAAEILSVAPEQPVTLALNAGFDANVIRRLGRTAGRLTFGAQPVNAVEQFERALALVDDMAVLRYEYANSLLYMESRGDTEKAIEQLNRAVQLEPAFSMEALDILYAKKRLQEVRNWQDTGDSFRQFDRQRRRYMRETGHNLYSVRLDPFHP